MFVDEVVLKLIAGSGGDGCTAFRREKYVEMGGPFGGNGGNGASIIFKADSGLETLLDLRYQKEIKGSKGENGKGKNQNGKNADDVVIKVPCGTVVTDLETGLVLCDLKRNGESFTVAKGGRGGRGNTAFKTKFNTAPNFSENGEPGEERKIKVEVKLLADAGLVGMPSVGKSTFISRVSKARPKIAEYHFTTLVPNLGVTKTRNGKSFVLADLPGLIENASLGEGLGDRFLKHIERTKVLIHVLDMAGTEGRNPYNDYVTINKELENFNKKLMKKPMIIVANKMDQEGAKDNLEEFKKKVKDKKIFEVSAYLGTGLQDVVDYIGEVLDSIKDEDLYGEDEIESEVLYKYTRPDKFKITRDGEDFVIEGKEIEKLFKMTKFESREAELRFAKRMSKMGIDKELKKMGAKDGDMVRILDFYFEYHE